MPTIKSSRQKNRIFLLLSRRTAAKLSSSSTSGVLLGAQLGASQQKALDRVRYVACIENSFRSDEASCRRYLFLRNFLNFHLRFVGDLLHRNDRVTISVAEKAP